MRDSDTTKRIFAGLLLLLGSTAAAAQGPGRATIGILYATRAGYALDAQITRSLHDIGWVENRNVSIERRYAEGRADRLPALAAELVRRGVNVIVAVSTPSTIAAKNATTTTPIVMVFVSDPVRSGLVSNLAHPGGNVTGVSVMGPELNLKALQLLKEAVPAISRVGIVVNPENSSHADIFRDLEASARHLPVKLKSLELRRPADVDALLTAALRERVEALLILPVNLDSDGLRKLSQRLPTLNSAGAKETFESGGGLIYHGPKITEHAHRVAFLVDKILKGVTPRDLPIEQPTAYEVVVNLKTAKALGITLPPSLLIRADQFIQ